MYKVYVDVFIFGLAPSKQNLLCNEVSALNTIKRIKVNGQKQVKTSAPRSEREALSEPSVSFDGPGRNKVICRINFATI